MTENKMPLPVALGDAKTPLPQRCTPFETRTFRPPRDHADGIGFLIGIEYGPLE